MLVNINLTPITRLWMLLNEVPLIVCLQMLLHKFPTLIALIQRLSNDFPTLFSPLQMLVHDVPTVIAVFEMLIYNIPTLTTRLQKRVNIIPANGARRKFPRGAKVFSQSCDVTNQLCGECRRHDHSRVVRGHAVVFIAFSKTAWFCFTFLASEGAMAQWPPPSVR